MEIRFDIHPRLLREFRRAALAAFPKETCCFLIGHDVPVNGSRREITVEELWFPGDVARFASKEDVRFQHHWFVEAEAHATETAMVVVGAIHSHPYPYGEVKDCKTLPDCSQSEHDLKYFQWNRTNGICRVIETKTGRKHTKFRFWGPLVPLAMVER